MNLKDKRILYELDLNSRQSFNQIAKKVKLSPETTRYRFLSLNERQIIYKPMAVINSAALGYSIYEVYLKLKKMTESLKSNLIKYLNQDNKVAWIGEFDGPYDLGIILIVESPIDLKDFLEEFTLKFGTTIMKKTIAVNLKVEFLPRDYLIEKTRKNYQVKTYKVDKQEKYELDTIDTEICKNLAIDSRENTISLGKKLGISPDTIALRIKKLYNKKIITGSSIVLNNSKINQSHYKILLYLSNHNPSAVSSILELVRLNNRAISIVQTLSEWDYEIDLEVDSYEKIRYFLNELTNKHSDQIRDYELLRIISMPKYNFFP